MDTSPPGASSVNDKFIIAPKDTCNSCGKATGPKFLLTELSGPSIAHRSGCILTRSDRESKLSEIDQAGSEIDRLDEEIIRLQRTLNGLRKRRDALDRYKLQESSLFAPIRKLPEDILQHIFFQLLLQERRGFIYVYDRNTFARIITQVSFYWRSVSLSFPVLWSRMCVEPPYSEICRSPSVGGKMAVSFIEKSISLSGTTPLSLTFDILCDPDIFSDSCLQTIARSARRWENIVICNGDLLESIFIHIPADEPLTCLRSLNIYGITGSISLQPSPALTHLAVTGVKNSTSTISVRSAPSITHFDIDCNKHVTELFSPFPWSQITHFSYECNQFVPGELATLKHMPRLMSLTLRGRGINISDYIMLPQLQIMKIFPDQSSDSSNLLGFLITPSLKTLILSSGVTSSPIVEFLDRSQCLLEELTLWDIPLSEEWDGEGLSAVKMLALNWSKTPAEDLRVLTRDKGQNYSIFPRLERFKLEIANENETEVGMLMSMIKSRLPPPRPRRSQDTTDREVNPEVYYLKAVDITCKFGFSQRNITMLNDYIRTDLRCQKIDVRIK